MKPVKSKLEVAHGMILHPENPKTREKPQNPKTREKPQNQTSNTRCRAEKIRNRTRLRNLLQSRFQNLSLLFFNFMFYSKIFFFSFFDVLLCLQGIQQDEEIRRVQKESKARYFRWSLYCSLNF
jgi:tRNA-binding EMAP/Myf-like protein